MYTASSSMRKKWTAWDACSTVTWVSCWPWLPPHLHRDLWHKNIGLNGGSAMFWKRRSRTLWPQNSAFKILQASIGLAHCPKLVLPTFPQYERLCANPNLADNRAETALILHILPKQDWKQHDANCPVAKLGRKEPLEGKHCGTM